MRLPNVTDWVREVPVRALRTVFAGLGHVLLSAEQVREAEPAEPGEQADQARPARAMGPDWAGSGGEEPYDPLGADDHGPVSKPAKGGKPQAARAPRPGQARPGTDRAATGGTAGLPVAGYDGLSLASLRARLRTLDADQLGALITYEKANAGREDVISMFERRIARLRGQA